MTVQYMPLFRACLTSRKLTQLHAHLIVHGLHRNQLASTKLIESYARLGPLDSARLVFRTFQKPDSFMYGVLIKYFVWYGFFGEAISLYYNMLCKITQISGFVFPSVFRACSGFGDLGVGQKVHGRAIKCGFDCSSVVQTSLLNMYGEAGCLTDARKLFDEMPDRDIVSWSSMILSHVHNGQASEGLEFFHKMVVQGNGPDSVTLLSVAEACGDLGLRREAKSVHGYIVRKEIQSHGYLDNSLISMYGKCGELHSAENLFHHVPNLCTSSWTAMITCYNQNGYYEEALDIFDKMQESCAEPNAVTIMGILCSCARLCWLKEGKSVHGFVIRKHIVPENDLLRSALIDMYASYGNFKDCHKIFDKTRERHIVTWNILISGFTREGMSEEALTFFLQMLKEAIQPDEFTLASVVSACGDIGFAKVGSQIHGQITKTGVLNEFVQNSLIDMYSKCGRVDSAYMIFKDSQMRSVVTWNCMIWGFYYNGDSAEAISLFDEMHSCCLDMDEVTFLSAIQACSNLGYLEKGKWVHHKLILNGIQKDTYIDTALTDMYAKCGDLQMAQRVFKSMPEKTVVSWSAMIDAYGMHGHIDAAISVFNEMLGLGIQPNKVTFMNILSACSHAGCVREGKFYFKSMESDFGIRPELEHFSCLIDLLSRSGELDEAYRIINSMPYPVETSIWGSLLNGCRIHRRMDILARIQENLENVDDSGYHTLLSNIFAEGGDWNEFQMVRSRMESIGLRKVPGCSVVEIDKKAHKFGANDTCHSETKEICTLLDNLQRLAQ